MNILQLCCFSDLWHSRHDVTSIDLKHGIDIMNLSDDIGKEFDFIVSAPPCVQFSKVNAQRWNDNPKLYIDIAKKCFRISVNSGAGWMLENPAGRIETFLPELTCYRIVTWCGGLTNKEYVIYSNMMVLTSGARYGKISTHSNSSRKQRDRWQPDFISDIERSFLL